MNLCYLKNILFFKNRYFLYFLSFIILIILTLFPFLIVIKKLFSKEMTYFLVVLCLLVQVVVHIKIFFHLNFSNKHKWNLISMIFSFLIITIILLGSYWVMKHLNYHISSLMI
ncbi:cytochrome o ubiquinol oxidase subunit IV [Buchnera aphidicola]|uniref:Cytochrome bo(3) ubiquinol oxidase subunit 4 n=1 Tax=Buchnera aphidicola subsp. Melaphis rhois TaxID=118103 RepID=A0A4D6YCQ4_BUCMH|nr:cytochrome o ubiquinol oxidase subunit IV [Buchnera aphidicola]QCI23430.1 cytochrome o ubiquinol oxidase subunit IV [Buchnera aphidicola (Melaphis rhois)]